MPIKDVRGFIDAIDERKMNLNTRPFVSDKLRELVEFTDDNDTTKDDDIKGRLGQLKSEIKREFCDELKQTKEDITEIKALLHRFIQEQSPGVINEQDPINKEQSPKSDHA